MRKYHIINLPYSTLKGLCPPLHHFLSAGTTCAMFIVWLVRKFNRQSLNLDAFSTKSSHQSLLNPEKKNKKVTPEEVHKMPISRGHFQRNRIITTNTAA